MKEHSPLVYSNRKSANTEEPWHTSPYGGLLPFVHQAWHWIRSYMRGGGYFYPNFDFTPPVWCIINTVRIFVIWMDECILVIHWEEISGCSLTLKSFKRHQHNVDYLDGIFITA